MNHNKSEVQEFGFLMATVATGMKNSLDKVEKSNQAHTTEIQELGAIVRQGFSSLENTIKQTSTPLAVPSDFSVRFGAMESQVSALVQNIGSLTTGLKEVGEDIKQLSEMVVCLDKKVEVLDSDLNEIKTDVKSLPVKVEGLGGEIDGLDNKLSWLIGILLVLGAGVVGLITYYHKSILEFLISHS